jgi:hypothetical protein
MKYLIQDSDDVKLEDENLNLRLTPSYVEIAQKRESIVLYFYLIFHNNHSLIVATCWDHIFDKMQIEDEDDILNINDSYPSLAKLIRNTISGLFSQGALVRLEDPDDGEIKWFIVSIAGNLVINSGDDLFEGNTKKAIDTVLENSFTILGEFITNKPSYFGTIWRGFKKGLLMGLEQSVRINLKYDLSDLFGESETISTPTDPGTILEKKTFEEYIGDILDERRRR